MREYLTAIICCYSLCSTAVAADYTVKPSDTLWDIAAERLGDPWLWMCIHSMNPSIANPHAISEGTRLQLPDPANCQPNPLPNLTSNDRGSEETYQTESGEKELPSLYESSGQAYLITKTEGDIIIYDGNEFMAVPVALLAERLEREGALGEKTIGNSLTLDANLMKALMPKDPRFSNAHQGAKE